MSKMAGAVAAQHGSRTTWRDYYELCKPRVVGLMLITAFVGMNMATTGFVPWQALVFGTLGIALAAGSAAAINQLIDRRIDLIMARTQQRPLPAGRVTPLKAWIFAAVLGVLGMLVLVTLVNTLTAILTFCTLIGYAVIYTVFLKRATPQNIVIGGAAGAAPPVLGWVAVTGHFDPNSLLLMLIIYVWTPPHFWALAIHRYEEYARAEIPMLPVTHGIEFTKLNILLYTILLVVTSLMLYVVSLSGPLYLLGALVLGIWFIYRAVKLKRSNNKYDAWRMFRFSIVYLFVIFVLMLVDHYLLGLQNYLLA